MSDHILCVFLVETVLMQLGEPTVGLLLRGGAHPTESVTSSTPATCTVSGGSGVVTFTGVGTCTLTAQATATTDYLPATGSAQSFSVGQATATISIRNIPNNANEGGSFTPTYAYSGNGTTSVTSSTTGTCKVSGSVVNFVGTGTCTLVAHATATTDDAAATGSPQSFTFHRK
jgi:hypothetical protein